MAFLEHKTWHLGSTVSQETVGMITGMKAL